MPAQASATSAANRPMAGPRAARAKPWRRRLAAGGQVRDGEGEST